MKFRLLDLFSGIGGFSLGLERSGYFETVAFCEIEDYPRRVLKKHWPEVPIYDDVRTLYADRLVRDGIAVDAICGGFPCQDISFAGLGAGIEGSRSGLWREYARLIGELRPRYVIVENVAALLGRGMGRVLGDLAALGYDAEWECVPLEDIGAPHKRDRVWIVAYPKSERCAETGRLRYRELEKWISRCREANFSADIGKKRTKGHKHQEISGFGAFSWCKDVRRVEDFRSRPDIPTPLFRGSRDGISHWVDRIGALGNSVGPQIPELIGRAIGEYEARLSA